MSPRRVSIHLCSPEMLTVSQHGAVRTVHCTDDGSRRERRPFPAWLRAGLTIESYNIAIVPVTSSIPQQYKHKSLGLYT